MKKRVDKSVKRPPGPDEDPRTEAGFKRLRHNQVNDAMLGLDDALSLSFDLDLNPSQDSQVAALWGEGHEKEFQFQKGKQTRRVVEGFRDGLLDESEIDEADLALALEKEKKQDKELVRGNKSFNEMASKMNGPIDWDILTGQKIWVDSTLQNDPEVEVSLVKHNLFAVTERKEATLFAVPDCTTLSERVKLFAALFGLRVLDGSLLQGKPGFLVKFKASINTRQRVFFSSQFHQKHPDFEGTVMRAFNVRGSKWKPADNRSDATIKLVTTTEAARAKVVGGDDAGHHCKSSFLESISKMDFKNSGYYKP